MADLPRPVTFDLMAKDPDYYIVLTAALGDFASRERSDAECGNSPELSLKRAAAAEQILAEIEAGLSRQPSGPGGHWTAGELRAALAGVPDDTLIVVNTDDPRYPDMAEEWAIYGAGYGQVGWGDGYGTERDTAFGLSCRLADDFRVKPDRPRKENRDG